MFSFFVCSLFVLSALVYSYAILSQQNRPLPVKTKNTLLVIAHPDDECMFFGPTLTSLQATSPKTKVHVLCLSTGNADGLGKQREKELSRSCQVLGIAPSRLRTVDHAALQDGMTNEWSPAVIAPMVAAMVDKNKIDTIITFDDYGVSGHTNHRAAYRGVLAYQEQYGGEVAVYKLVSISVLRKYIGMLDILMMNLQARWLRRPGAASWTSISSVPAYLQTHMAMRQHRTQLVWFRWLYVTFSRYMFINELERVHNEK
ncbi:putative deacetylase LmbE-like domain-containing protein [Gongronella butleri]|nr:putative deacetylase LmbE-like domain-containing protein [Gongronella butleri]